MTNPNELINNSFYGLTKREYFVGIALQGILSSTNSYKTEESVNIAIEIADVLINKLNESQNLSETNK